MRWFQRLLQALLLGGQVIVSVLRGRLYRRNTFEQLTAVGTDSLGIVLLTAVVISGVFTIQVAREFISFGASSAIGGVLSLALAREMTPVITAVVLAGRVGSAFAAELGTMEVSEQVDALRVLRTEPVEYLVVPRVFACCLMTPVLTVLSLIVGIIGGLVVCVSLYGLNATMFLSSAQNFLTTADLLASLLKSLVFGALIAVIGCNWGLTTTGGAKGVGRSTTAAVVTALLSIFVTNFFMSWLFFQGTGSALSNL